MFIYALLWQLVVSESLILTYVVYREEGLEMSKKVMLVVLIVLACAVSSCKGVSSDNYDKLKVGMEFDAVSSILGKPDNCRAVLNMKNCIWTDGEQEIRIKFAAEQVVFTASRGL